jgi:hypothetical protein
MQYNLISSSQVGQGVTNKKFPHHIAAVCIKCGGIIQRNRMIYNTPALTLVFSVPGIEFLIGLYVLA